MEKYRLTEETKDHLGITLHRIQALRDFGNVKKGDLGGWVESEDNLSQKGECWVYDDALVYDNAMVYDNSMVYGNALVYDNSHVYGNARVYEEALVSENARVCGNSRVFGNSQVYGEALVSGNAQVYDNAQIFENAQIYENAHIYENSWVYGNSWVCGNSLVYGNVQVYGNARVFSNAMLKEKTDFICISPIGSRDSSITFYRTKDDIYVVTGCFNGSIDTFEKAVHETHGDNKYAEQYRLAIELAKSRIE